MRRIWTSLFIAAAAVVPAGLGVGAMASGASAATTTAAATTCKTTYTRTTPPTKAETFTAGPAGKVTVGPGAHPGNVRVLSVAPAPGWKYFVDTASGNSVDVYFHNPLHRVKFEAGLESPTLMVVMVQVC